MGSTMLTDALNLFTSNIIETPVNRFVIPIVSRSVREARRRREGSEGTAGRAETRHVWTTARPQRQPAAQALACPRHSLRETAAVGTPRCAVRRR